MSEHDGSFTISAVPASDPITVTATDAHGQAISESFHLAVGDSGPTATTIADQSAYEGQSFSLNVIEPLHRSCRRRYADLLGRTANRASASMPIPASSPALRPTAT